MMKNKVALKLLSICALSAAVMLSTPSVQAQQVTTVASVDLSRYVGTWYEIARFPNRFQTQCRTNVRAIYRARTDGAIDVTNSCVIDGGKTDQAEGLARIIAGSNNAKLQVRFAPAWLSWLPQVWGDYWIIDLTPDYSVVTVGTPARDYLWILARTPELSTAQYETAVNNATRQGFDTSKLIKTVQEQGAAK